LRIRWLLPAVLLPLSSCGLIDSSVTDFDLSLPRTEITLDTAQWQMQVSGEFPAVSCSAQPGVCAAASQEYCTGANCFPACDGTNCKVTVQVVLWHMFDLLTEKPELAQIENQPLVSVTIDKITYDVTENTLNVSTPELTVYVAPVTVMNPGDPQARAIGTIAALGPGLLVTDKQLVLSADAQQILKEYLKDFRTPFNLIVGGVVDVQAGDPVPEGKLIAVVNIAAHAGI
jgi:hypothetical protein